MATVDDLGDEIATLAAHLDAATHRLLTCIREFDRSNGWSAHGALTCAHWLSWRIGLDPATAREKVRVARALGDLPKIDDALRRATLSYAKVRALTRVATSTTEEQLLEIALHTTAAQLERICRGFRAMSAADPAHPGARERWLSDRALPNGMVKIEIVLHSDEAALVLKAVERAREDARAAPKRQASDVSAETPAAGQTGAMDAMVPDRVDGLVAVAEGFLARGPTVGSGGDRFQVFVHLAQEPLAAGGSLAATLDDGTRVSAEAFRRVACDAAVVAATATPGGAVLDIGRRTRTIPPAIRRALWLRDRGCRFPGCTNRTYVHGHHIRHWIHGGETRLGNLVLLCSAHHRMVHEASFSTRCEADGSLVFFDSKGQKLPGAPVPAPSAHDPVVWLEDWVNARGIKIGTDANCLAWDGTTPDYDSAIDAVMVAAAAA